MIYVQLQDGRSIFSGDSAPMRRNVSWLRPRSRYAAHWQGSEARSATMGWIKGLAALQDALSAAETRFLVTISAGLQGQGEWSAICGSQHSPRPPASQSASDRRGPAH